MNQTSDEPKATGCDVEKSVARMQAAYNAANQSETKSRKSLLIATAEGALLARAALLDPAVMKALAERYTTLTDLKFSAEKVDLTVAVIARSATDPAMRAKAGKMGRAIGKLRLMQLRTVEELVSHLEDCGGIEGLLAQKSPPPLSPNELIVACTPELLIKLLINAGGTATLKVDIGPTRPGGMTPVQLLSVVVDDPFSEPFDEDEDEDDNWADDGPAR